LLRVFVLLLWVLSKETLVIKNLFSEGCSCSSYGFCRRRPWL